MEPENQNQDVNSMPDRSQVPPANAAGASEPSAPLPMPGQVISSGPGMSSEPAAPVSPASSVSPAQPNPAQPSPAQPAGRRRSLKPLIITLIVLILLVGGAAAAYFGYYMNPSVILSQSLSRTGKGYDKLINYVNQQSETNYKGSTASGTYSIKSSNFSTDGDISFKSNGSNSDTNFSVGLATTRAKVELRTIKSSSGSTPDIYLKASGIEGLGSLLGPDADKTFNNLNGKWIAIDHTLIDNLSDSAASSSVTKLPTQAQVMDELKAFGNVNQQYVFTTDKDKSITTVMKKYGTENVDGHKTYHYKMALNKVNLKAYISAQQKALNSSQLEAWIKKNKLQDSVNKFFSNLQTESKSVSSKDNFDLWVDVNKRLVYKVRLPEDKNPAVNYADIGLDYKGGSDYPFFITAQNKDGDNLTTGSLTATLDSKNNSLAVKLAFKTTGTVKSDFNANLTYQPANNVSKIIAPSDSESLSQVLDQLGLSDLLPQQAAKKTNLN